MNKVVKRFSAISRGENKDLSDEYYTLNHCFVAFLIELLARYRNNIKYKVIICPCDNNKSVFRRLEEYKEYLGNPLIVYSYYPQKDWQDYFNIDFEKEFGYNSNEVIIFTNPPFKGLASIFRKKLIQCNFLLMGSLCTRIINDIYVLNKKSFTFIKNTELNNKNIKYGKIPLIFISNQKFFSYGEQYIKSFDNKKYNPSLMFEKNKLQRIYNNILYK